MSWDDDCTCCGEGTGTDDNGDCRLCGHPGKCGLHTEAGQEPKRTPTLEERVAKLERAVFDE